MNTIESLTSLHTLNGPQIKSFLPTLTALTDLLIRTHHNSPDGI